MQTFTVKYWLKEHNGRTTTPKNKRSISRSHFKTLTGAIDEALRVTNAKIARTETSIVYSIDDMCISQTPYPFTTTTERCMKCGCLRPSEYVFPAGLGCKECYDWEKDVLDIN